MFVAPAMNVKLCTLSLISSLCKVLMHYFTTCEPNEKQTNDTVLNLNGYLKARAYASILPLSLAVYLVFKKHTLEKYIECSVIIMKIKMHPHNLYGTNIK